MAAPRKISDQQRELIRQVFQARQQLPSDKDLAKRIGVTVRAIRWTMAMLSFKTVSVETDPGMIQQDGRSRPDRI